MKCKTTLLALSSFAFFSLVMISCKKSNSSSGASGTISASIHDSTFQSQAANSDGVYSSSQNGYLLNGVYTGKTDTSIVQIYIQGPIRVGAAVNTDTVGSFVAYYDVNNSFDWQAGGAGGGTAIYTVTSLDTTNHTIAGTFSGSLYDLLNTSGTTVDSVNMTGGKFNLTYIVQ